MHRLLVETEQLNCETPLLPKEAQAHLRVLRPKAGEEFELFDGRGRWRIYRYEKDLVAASGICTAESPKAALTLFACVTKGSRWDWTIEKATELGATRIVPVISDRTIVRLPQAERVAKCERWRRIAEDAARQSDAKWIPEIRAAVDFADALPLVRETTCFVGALTNPPSRPLADAIADHPSRSVATFIGPEGDFTPDELAALLEIAVPTSFGPSVLRAETAAIFALSVLSSRIFS